MNAHCDKLVEHMDSLLKDPVNHSVAYFARQIYEEGYIAGKEMERKLLRLKLGLNVPGDDE
jgi:hypothetical protein